MYTLLLAVIYIAFISLGLPDTMLGSAWPSMQPALAVPVSYAGVLSMIIAAGTIVSSFFSGKVIAKLGTGKVTAISVAMTCAALFGFSISTSFFQLCLWGIPYGLGAGSVDAALNNYVALKYKARHMSWLHCFWGVGASLGPYIMGFYLTRGYEWNMGYQVIGIIQLVLTIMLFLSLPLWKEKKIESQEEVHAKSIPFSAIIRMKGAKEVLLSFLAYCGVETTTGLWAASYMVLFRQIDTGTAAKWASLFYVGITIGRLISGFVTNKLGDQNMIRIGEVLMGIGIVLIILPIGNFVLFSGLILVGLGCAPVYPSLLHATPNHFSKEASQSIMGIQMACAYIGSTFLPPLFGLLQQWIGISFYPFYLLIFLIVMIIMVEKIQKAIGDKS